MVMNLDRNEKFMDIKILKNRYEEIRSLKFRFFRTLIDISKSKLEEIYEPILHSFQNYVINYIPEVEVFNVTIESNNITEATNMLMELNYFDQNFMMDIVTHFE